MSDETPIHEQCTRHDGQEGKTRIILWLLCILIAINVSMGGALYAGMSDVKSSVSVVSYKLQTFESADSRLDTRLNQIEIRLREIEMERKK